MLRETVCMYEVEVEYYDFMTTDSTVYNTYDAAERAFQEECDHRDPRFFKNVKLNKVLLHYGNGDVFYIELVERVAETKV